MIKAKGLFIFLVTIVVSFYGSAQSKPEAKMGEKQLKLLELTYGFYNNPELQGVIEEVGQNLEKHLGLEYKLKYHLLDMEEPNAFATAGGYVYVTRGLLALLNTKDELAGVLGHELTHVTEHHNTKKKRANILPAILEIPANIVGLLTTAEVAYILNLPIEATFGAGLASYSRSMEKQADKLGIQVAAKAGYDPYALGDILLRLESFVEFLTNQEMKKSIYLDHPITSKRVESIIKQNEKSGLERKETKPGTTIIEIEGLIFGQNPLGGIVKDSAFMHPTFDFYCEFPPKWEVNNSPQAITALANNKKAVLIITVEESSYVADLVKKEIDKYEGCEVLQKGDREINGLKGFNLVLNVPERNKESKRLDVFWLKLEDKDVLIKAQAVAQISDFPQAEIKLFFESIRMATKDDLDDFSYETIELRQVVDSSNETTENLNELTKIINGVTSQKSIPPKRHIKEIKEHQLIELN